MSQINHSVVKKYITSAVVGTGIIFSPMLTGAAFAQGGPDTEVNQTNDHQPTNVVQVDYFSKGDRGEGVESLQDTLQEKGYTANPDGMFGQETRRAVVAFQADNHLQVDGFAGPETKRALSLESTSKVTQTPNANEDGELTLTAKNAQQEDGTANSTNVVSTAKGLLGNAYTAGGTTPAGFDSSGFINYVFAQAGVFLDRTHADMWANNGEFVDQPSVGDVVFFKDTYKNGVSHSGVYVGNQQMIHAGTSQSGVEMTNLNYDYWQDRYIGAKSFN